MHVYTFTFIVAPLLLPSFGRRIIAFCGSCFNSIDMLDIRILGFSQCRFSSCDFFFFKKWSRNFHHEPPASLPASLWSFLLLSALPWVVKCVPCSFLCCAVFLCQPAWCLQPQGEAAPVQASGVSSSNANPHFSPWSSGVCGMFKMCWWSRTWFCNKRCNLLIP